MTYKLGRTERSLLFRLKLAAYGLLDRLAISLYSSLPDLSRLRVKPLGRATKVLIDVTQFCQDAYVTGIQRVAKQLIQGLLNSPESSENVVLVSALIKRGLVGNLNDHANGEGLDIAIHAYCDVDINCGDVVAVFDNRSVRFARFLWFILRCKIRGAKFVTFVHDLFPNKYPEYFTEVGRVKFRRWIYLVFRLSDQILVPTDYIKNSVIESLVTSSLRHVPCETLYLGGDFSKHDNGTVRETLRTSTTAYLLVVGTIEPRKGIGQLVDAFHILWRDGFKYQLVLVGRNGWNNDEIVKKICNSEFYGSSLLWVQDANDHELQFLYENARGVIVASYDEGFCLPLAEAMALNKPIFARDIPVTRELGGNGVTLFRTSDDERLATGIVEWLDSTEEYVGVAVPYLWEDSVWKLRRLLLEQPVHHPCSL